MNKHELIKNVDSYFFKQLKKYPLPPPYKVKIWSRDCDMVEITRITTYLTYISLIKGYSDWLEGLEWAEGPSSWELVDPKTETGYHGRDRVMQNYENGGNGYLV